MSSVTTALTYFSAFSWYHNLSFDGHCSLYILFYPLSTWSFNAFLPTSSSPYSVFNPDCYLLLSINNFWYFGCNTSELLWLCFLPLSIAVLCVARPWCYIASTLCPILPRNPCYLDFASIHICKRMFIQCWPHFSMYKRVEFRVNVHHYIPFELYATDTLQYAYYHIRVCNPLRV